MHETMLEYPCAFCGATNRIPKGRVLENPTCGACHNKLFPKKPQPATDNSFARDVEQSPIPVLVDFWAPWCGPCRTVGPVLEKIAAERAGKLKIVKVNVDDNPGVAQRFGISSIPAMKLFDEGRVVDELVGAMPKPHLEQFLDQALR